MRERGRRRSIRSIVGVLLLIANIGLPPAASAQEPAVEPAAVPSIVGTITDGVGPVAGAYVTACPTAITDYCDLEGYAETATDGTYTIPVAAGSYHVEVEPSWQDTLHEGGWYSSATASGYVATRDQATAVTVSTGPVTADVRLPRAPTISGTITTAGIVPVAGASVWICEADGFDCQYPDTDALGRYSSRGLTPGTAYTVQVLEPYDNPLGVIGGWYRAGVTGNYTGEEATATAITVTSGDRVVSVTLPTGLRISGTVRAPDDSPVVGSYVAICAAATRAYCDAIDYVRTSSTGDYSSGALRPGSYLVEVNEPFPNDDDLIGGYYRTGVTGNYTSSIADASAIPLTTSDATANVTLPKGIRIRGTVTRPGGAPIADASVSVCTATSDPDCNGAVTSGVDGAYRSDLVTPGASYVVLVSAPSSDESGVVGGWYAAGGLVRTADEATPITMTTGDRTLDLALVQGVRIGGRISGPTDSTPVRAYVQVCRLVGAQCDGVDWLASERTTGQYVSDWLFPGTFKVEVDPWFDDTTGLRSGWYRADGIGGFTSREEDASEIVVLTGDATANVTLPGGYRVTGTIRTDDTLVLGGATVELCPRTGGWCAETTTASDGTYRTPPLDDGAYRIQVSPPYPNTRAAFGGWYDVSVPTRYFAERYRATWVVVGVGNVTGIDMTLPRGRSIVGTVATSDGTAVAGAAVEACPTLGYCVAAATQENGSFVLGPVADGDWRIAASPPYPNAGRLLSGWYARGAPGNYGATIGSATTVTVPTDVESIDIRLPRGASIRGQVTATDGTAVYGALVLACQASGACVSGTSNATGDYTAGVLAPGTYTVTISVDQHDARHLLGGTYWTSATDGTNLSTTGIVSTPIVVGSSDVTVSTVRLPRGRLITGRITGPDGTTPIGDAWVEACPTTGSGCRSGWTDAQGEFTTGTLLPNRSYRVEISVDLDHPNRVLPGWYVQGASGSYGTSEAGATAVAVGAADVRLATVALPPGGAISGQIRSAGTDAGLAATRIAVFATDGTYQLGTWTDASGDFTTGALRAGRYLVYAERSAGFLGGWYASGRTGNHSVDETAATAIVLAAGGTASIAMALPVRAVTQLVRVSGRVTSLAGGVRGADVGLCTIDHDCIRTTTELDGSFAIPDVFPGPYRLEVTAPIGAVLADGWYTNATASRHTTDGSAATSIAVTTGDVAIPTITLPAAGAPAAPVVTVHPVGQTVPPGIPVILYAAARAGSSPVVWWEIADSSTGTWEHYPSYGTTDLLIDTGSWMNGFWYRAAFANAGGVRYSNPAQVLVRTRQLQAITFTLGTTPVKAGASLALAATASSGLPVTFSSSTPLYCSVSGTTVRFIKAGFCTVVATQAGNDDFLPAPSVSRTVSVTLTKPTLYQRFGTSTSTISSTSLTVRKGLYFYDRVIGPKALAGKYVQLWSRPYGSTWRRIVTLKFDSLGRATYRILAAKTTDYQWRFVATGIWAASTTATQRVTVR